jgi:flagellar biosynthetic protein FliS
VNPYDAYRQPVSAAATRIELLLALFDGAIERVSTALADLREGREGDARNRIARAQLIVSELSAGVRPEFNPELSVSILRLYEFVVHQLSLADLYSVTSALDVLRKLRAGFEAIRSEAIKLERTGQIPPLDSEQTVSAIA